MTIKNGIVTFIALLVLSATVGCFGGVGTAIVVSTIIYYEVEKTHDVAEVQINAPPEAVYRKTLEVMKENPDIKITEQKDKDLKIEFMKGERKATITITKIKKSSGSDVMVESKKTKGKEEQYPEIVLEAITKICDKLNVTYKVVPYKNIFDTIKDEAEEKL